MINSIQLMGNLGKDPEMRTTPAGQSYCYFSLATSSSRQVDGAWVTDTEWHNIKLWGKSATRASEQLKKGARCYVEGKISSYEVDGQRRIEIKAYSFKALDKLDHLLPPDGPPTYQSSPGFGSWSAP